MCSLVKYTDILEELVLGFNIVEYSNLENYFQR